MPGKKYGSYARHTLIIPKKVAYPLYFIAGMQLLSLHIINDHKIFCTLLAYV